MACLSTRERSILLLNKYMEDLGLLTQAIHIYLCTLFISFEMPLKEVSIEKSHLSDWLDSRHNFYVF